MTLCSSIFLHILLTEDTIWCYGSYFTIMRGRTKGKSQRAEDGRVKGWKVLVLDGTAELLN